MQIEGGICKIVLHFCINRLTFHIEIDDLGRKGLDAQLPAQK